MRLTNLQLELLKTFSFDLSESQIGEIREILANYFSQKTISEMDKFWEENNWSNEVVEEIAGEHLRTEYK